MKDVKYFVGGIIALWGLCVFISSFSFARDTDGKYPIKAHLNNIEGLIALTGGLIIIFM
jgi:hypothetical protein